MLIHGFNNLCNNNDLLQCTGFLMFRSALEFFMDVEETLARQSYVLTAVAISICMFLLVVDAVDPQKNKRSLLRKQAANHENHTAGFWGAQNL